MQLSVTVLVFLALTAVCHAGGRPIPRCHDSDFSHACRTAVPTSFSLTAPYTDNMICGPDFFGLMWLNLNRTLLPYEVLGTPQLPFTPVVKLQNPSAPTAADIAYVVGEQVRSCMEFSEANIGAASLDPYTDYTELTIIVQNLPGAMTAAIDAIQPYIGKNLGVAPVITHYSFPVNPANGFLVIAGITKAFHSRFADSLPQRENEPCVLTATQIAFNESTSCPSVRGINQALIRGNEVVTMLVTDPLAHLHQGNILAQLEGIKTCFDSLFNAINARASSDGAGDDMNYDNVKKQVVIMDFTDQASVDIVVNFQDVFHPNGKYEAVSRLAGVAGIGENPYASVGMKLYVFRPAIGESKVLKRRSSKFVKNAPKTSGCVQIDHAQGQIVTSDVGPTIGYDDRPVVLDSTPTPTYLNSVASVVGPALAAIPGVKEAIAKVSQQSMAASRNIISTLATCGAGVEDVVYHDTTFADNVGIGFVGKVEAEAKMYNTSKVFPPPTNDLFAKVPYYWQTPNDTAFIAMSYIAYDLHDIQRPAQVPAKFYAPGFPVVTFVTTFCDNSDIQSCNPQLFVDKGVISQPSSAPIAAP